MASHFSTIGISVNSKEQFIEYMKNSFEYGEKITTSKGTYLKWVMGNGVELWGQIDESKVLIGLNPFFRGQSRTQVKVEEVIYQEGNTELDGAFRGWAGGKEEESDCTYPFVFDVPNIAVYENIKIPQWLEFHLTAFAHDISAYSNDEEFNSSQEGEVKFAAEAFIPSGLFSLKGEEKFEPEAFAIFNGHVMKTAELINPVTNNKFLWALVRTLGAEFDVVIDPSILKGELKVGGVVSGSFWLTGVIVD